MIRESFAKVAALAVSGPCVSHDLQAAAALLPERDGCLLGVLVVNVKGFGERAQGGCGHCLGSGVLSR